MPLVTHTLSFVYPGRDLIAREKRRRQRAEEAAIRRNNNAALANKYRGGAAGMSAATAATGGQSPLGPNDGLLRDSDAPLAYSSVGGPAVDRDMHRSLSQEINERFGQSTHVQVGFSGGLHGESDFSDDEAVGVPRFGRSSRGAGAQPPRGLFDDV